MLVPSERACRRHKRLLDVGRRVALQPRHWLPGRDLAVVSDSGFSADSPRNASHLHHGDPSQTARRSARPSRPAAAAPRDRTPTDQRRVAVEAGCQGLALGGDRRAKLERAGERTIEIASDTAVWRYDGLAVVPIRSRAHPQSRYGLPAPWRCRSPTDARVQIRSRGGSCGAGPSRSLSTKCAPGSASRRSGSGRPRRLSAPHPSARLVLHRRAAGRTAHGTPTRRGRRIIP